jgi:hypothetical protein
MLCSWPAWALLLDDQLEHLRPRIRAIPSLSKSYPDHKARYDAWVISVHKFGCAWLEGDSDAMDHFLMYLSGYKELTQGTAISATFDWSKVRCRIQHCFMAERELNLPPYALWHPLFLSWVLPASRAATGAARVRGAPHDLDHATTMEEWYKSRGNLADTDDGLTARIKRNTPDRTPASLKAVRDALSHIVVVSDDEVDSKNDESSAAPPAQAADDDETRGDIYEDDEPDVPYYYESTGELFPGQFD